MQRRWLVPIVALGLALPAVAASQEGDPAVVDQARTHFELGVTLMQNENWEAAAVELQQSLDLHPTRAALFNLGNCEKAMHHYTAALAWFDRWLAEYGESAPAEEREAVEEAIAELQRLFGELVVTVAPDGAEVRIDDEPAGIAPLAGPLRAEIGRRNVTATLEGYLPAEAEAVVTSGGRAEVTLTLERAPPPETPMVVVQPPEDTSIWGTGVAVLLGFLSPSEGDGWTPDRGYVDFDVGAGFGVRLQATGMINEYFGLQLPIAYEYSEFLFDGRHELTIGLGARGLYPWNIVSFGAGFDVLYGATLDFYGDVANELVLFPYLLFDATFGEGSPWSFELQAGAEVRPLAGLPEGADFYFTRFAGFAGVRYSFV